MGKKSDDHANLVDLLESKDSKDYQFRVALREASKIYKVGKAQRPDFKHDNGHLDKFPKRDPTVEDYKMLAKWVAWLNASELACEERTFFGLDFSFAPKIEKCRENLPQGNRWYRNFLYGKGKPLTIDYELYLKYEENGRDGVIKIAKEFLEPAEILGHNRVNFSMTSTQMIPVGNGAAIKGPTTPNWLKTIGAHQIWVNADVTVSAQKGNLVYDANLTLNVEDQYNFNPGQKDEHTKIADAENGMLELSGLGHQFMTYGKIQRRLQWIKGDYESAIITGPNGPVKLNAKYW